MSDTPLTLAALAPQPLWVAWQTEDRPDGKPTKVPYAPNGRKAKADAPDTWGTRPQAEERAIALPKPYGTGGVGIEFTSIEGGRNLAGIDLDACRVPETGSLESWAEDVLANFDSYAEVSPSGTGAKLYFTYPDDALPELRAHMGAAQFGKMFKQPGEDHPPGIELHLGNRYFAVTDDILDGSRPDLRHVEPAKIVRLLQHDGPAFIAAGDPAPAANSRRSRDAGRTDRSRSAAAFSVGTQAVRDGADFAAMCDALRQHPETAAWMREKGEVDSAREARRIFEKASHALPLIRVVAGKLHTITTEAEAAIIKSGVPLYQRGRDLVRPSSRQVPAAYGRTTLAAGLSSMNGPAAIDLFCQVAEWERFDKRSGEWVRTDPPRMAADILLSRHGQWQVPAVAGVITTPTMRPDGSILAAAGYDAATRLYHEADPTLRLASELSAPTREDAVAALATLDRLLAEFPFVSPVSRAVALSALITPVVRGALPVVPLHAFRANTAGTGKSYLADTSSALATGRPCPVIAAAPGDEIETEKRLAGLLLAGFPIVSLDNINGELGGDLLCQAIERPFVRLRPLGRSDIVEIESRASLFATGNNLRVRGDMVRRSLVCDLDAGLERPELRHFAGDPVAAVLDNRSRFVSAALIIVRAYIRAGLPGCLSTIASFEAWSDLVRSPLVWLGCADPAASMEAARDDDPELAELREVIGAWKTAHRYVPTTCRRAIDNASDTSAFPGLHDALSKVASGRFGIDSLRLGRWLQNREGRIVGQERFKRDGITDGAMRWKLEPVRPQGG